MNHSAFLTWVLLQFINNFSLFNQSDSFKTEWRFHQFLSFSSNQSDESKSTVSLSLKLTLFEIYSYIFILTDKSIFYDLLLSQNMINNNNSQHSDILMSMFFKAQMQIFYSMIVQIKKEDCIKDYVNTVNSTSQQNFFWCFNVINLSCCSEQSYSEQWNLSWCCQYNFNFDNSDNFDESVLNILNVFWRHCNNDDTQFCSKEMSFFNLHLDVKNYSIDNIIDINDKFYFQDVYLFIDSFKNVVYIKTEKVIHWNLNKYLWNIIQNWYID